MTDKTDNVTGIGEAKKPATGKAKAKASKPADKGPQKAQPAQAGVINIFERINNFTQEFGGVVKDKTNDFLGSDYADLVTVWSSIKPDLRKHGIGISQMPGSYALAKELVPTLITQLYCVGPNSPELGSQGWQVSSQSPLIIGKKTSQGFGAALKYARRYHIVTLLNIAEYDDDGQAEEDARISARVTSDAKDALKFLVDGSSNISATVTFINGKYNVPDGKDYLDVLNPGQVASLTTLLKSKQSK